MTPEKLLAAMTDIDSSIIEEARQSAPRRSYRRLTTVLVAAALLLVITACAAVAGGADWFKLFFTEQGGAVLSDSQNAYIEGNVKDIAKSITQNGYTITLESAISDGQTGYVKLKLTAPEDTVLDADFYSCSSFVIPVNEEGESSVGSAGWDTIDQDKTDNVVHLLYTMGPIPGSWNMSSLTDGHTWTLEFQGLTAQYKENWETDPTIRSVPLTDGIWRFDVVFSEDGDTEIELVTEPVTIPTQFCLVYGEYIDAKITSLKLRAMSAVMSFTYVDGKERNDWFDEFYVVMKDGSNVLMRCTAGWPGKTTYAFDAPIVLEDVDYVLLPGGGKLRMP